MGFPLGADNMFNLFGTTGTFTYVIIYGLGNIAAWRYFRTAGRDESSVIKYVIFPLVATAALLYIAYKSYIPLPAAPVVFAPVIVGVYVAAGIGCLLWALRPGRREWMTHAGAIEDLTQVPATAPRGVRSSGLPAASAPRTAAGPPRRRGGLSAMKPTEDRYQAILRLVAAKGRVSIAELTRQLKVSEMTIRRDLAALDAEGAVRRVRGGAVPVASGSYEPPFTARAKLNAAAKRDIAARGLEADQRRRDRHRRRRNDGSRDRRGTDGTRHYGLHAFPAGCRRSQRLQYGAPHDSRGDRPPRRADPHRTSGIAHLRGPQVRCLHNDRQWHPRHGRPDRMGSR